MTNDLVRLMVRPLEGTNTRVRVECEFLDEFVGIVYIYIYQLCLYI